MCYSSLAKVSGWDTRLHKPNYQASFAFLPSPFFDNGISLWASEDDAKFSFGPLSELCDNGVIFGLCCRSHGLQDLVSWRWMNGEWKGCWLNSILTVGGVMSYPGCDAQPLSVVMLMRMRGSWCWCLSPGPCTRDCPVSPQVSHLCCQFFDGSSISYSQVPWSTCWKYSWSPSYDMHSRHLFLLFRISNVETYRKPNFYMWSNGADLISWQWHMALSQNHELSLR